MSFWRRFLLGALAWTFVFGIEPVIGLLIYAVPLVALVRAARAAQSAATASTDAGIGLSRNSAASNS